MMEIVKVITSTAVEAIVMSLVGMSFPFYRISACYLRVFSLDYLFANATNEP